MVSIAFDTFVKLMQEKMRRQQLDWIRDMRDPADIGTIIINRPKGETATQAADRIELMLLPKYR